MSLLILADINSHHVIKGTIVDCLTYELKELSEKPTDNSLTPENLRKVILAAATRAAHNIRIAAAGGPGPELEEKTVAHYVQIKEGEKVAKQKDIEALEARIAELEDWRGRVSS